MNSEWIEKLHYFAGVLFSEEDRIICMIVLSMVVMLPVLLCILRWKPLVRGTALIVFAVYVLGNLSFTILNRSPGYFGETPALFNFRQAFYLDYGFRETLELLSERLAGCEGAVVPGFYGSDASGRIVTWFSSDHSFAVFSRSAWSLWSVAR